MPGHLPEGGLTLPHFRVDDGLDAHPKAQRAGDEALGMWVRAGAWCMRYLTDGFIPEWWVKQQPRGTAKAKRLVDAGLWDPSESDGEKGWQFHEFIGNGRQDSRAQIEAEREKWRQKKAAQRMSPGDTPGDRRPMSPGDTPPMSPGDSLHVTRDPTQPSKNDGGHLESASQDSTEREPRSAPIRPDANRLVAEIIPDSHPTAVRTELRLQASALLNQGQPPDLVADALRLWATKTVHPKTLPSLVSELINQANKPATTSTNGKPNKMRTLADIARETAEQETRNRKELPA